MIFRLKCFFFRFLSLFACKVRLVVTLTWRRLQSESYELRPMCIILHFNTSVLNGDRVVCTIVSDDKWPFPSQEPLLIHVSVE